MTFKVGIKYQTRMAGDHNAVLAYTVSKRTEKTVTIVDDEGKTAICRVSTRNGEEIIMPLGRYSMAPVLRASGLAPG